MIKTKRGLRDIEIERVKIVLSQDDLRDIERYALSTYLNSIQKEEFEYD